MKNRRVFLKKSAKIAKQKLDLWFKKIFMVRPKRLFIFAMGAVKKALEVDEWRAASDHTRFCINAATVLDFLLQAYDLLGL